MSNRRAFIKKASLLGASMLVPTSYFSLELLSFDAYATEFSIEDLMGKSKIKLVGDGFNLRQEAAAALKKMLQAAAKSGYNPYIVSSYRSYNHQKRIWNNKFDKFTRQGLSPKDAINKIIKYSTIPGTSRHHWGTDFDIIASAKNIPSNPLNEKHFNPGGQYHEFKLWLNKHAAAYGFLEVYTNTKGRKGFEYEPWHLSYAPTACEMLSQYLEKQVLGQLYHLDIKGAEHMTQDFLSQYLTEHILDINPELIP